MKYKVIQKSNPRDKEASQKWYANAVNSGKITLNDIAKQIEGRSSLTRGDIENVLTNFMDQLPLFLKLGYSVQLGEFATLRLNLSSEGVEEKKEFKAHHIKGTKVIFTPSSALKYSLKGISFENIEKGKEAEVTEVAP